MNIHSNNNRSKFSPTNSHKSDYSEMMQSLKLNNYQNKSKQENKLETIINTKIKSDKHDDWSKELSYSITLSNNVVSLVITDNDDPLFYYKSSINESEFQQIKSQQNLLIDFQQFPFKITEMFELCKENVNMEYSNNISILKGTSNFCCVIEEKSSSSGEADLMIQETTQFRNLTHLKLNIKIPSDNHLKKHLSTLSKDFKSKYELSSERIKILEEKLESATNKILSVQDEVKSLEASRNLDISTLKLESDKKMLEIKSEYDKEISDLKKAFDNILEEKTNKLLYEYDCLKKEKDQIEAKYSHLSEENNDLICQFKKISINNDNNYKEVNSLVEENKTLKQENKELFYEKHINEKNILELNIKLNAAQNQLKDKEDTIIMNNKMIEDLRVIRVRFLFY